MKTTRKLLLALVLVMSILMTLAVAVIPASAASAVTFNGTFNSWNGTDTTLVDGWYTAKIQLNAGWYEFKVIDNGTWKGNSGTIANSTEYSSSAGWEFNSGDNCKLYAGAAGEYTFMYKNGYVKVLCPETATTKIALKPNTDWKKDGARFAVYFYKEDNGKKAEAWVSLSNANNDGYYEGIVPVGYTYIFTRMNGSTTTNNWNNKWNEAKVTTDPSTYCYYSISGWDNAGSVTTNHSYTNNCDADCNVCGATRTAPHTYSGDCDATCNNCVNGNRTTSVEHTHTNNCDADCNVCGATRTAPHTYSGNCDTACNNCVNGNRTTNVEHSYDNNCDTTCNVCDATRTAPHTYSGNCDTACNNCVNGNRTTNVEHSYDNNCDSTCNVCDATRTAPHSYFYPCDAHCMVCGNLTNEDASHTIEYVEAKAPTCTENGNVEYWYCSDCGSAWLDVDCTVVANQYSVKLGATCATNAVYTEGVEAGCHNTGLIENWYCANCDVYYLDANCTIITNYKSLVIPALGYSAGCTHAAEDAEGNGYATLAEALATKKEVYLLSDVTIEGAFKVSDGQILNLNGKTVRATSAVIFGVVKGDGNVIVDVVTEEGKVSLYASKNTQGVVPVCTANDGTIETYIFRAVTTLTAEAPEGKDYFFRPTLSGYGITNNQIFCVSGIHGLELKIKVTRALIGGTEDDKDIAYVTISDEAINAVFSSTSTGFVVTLKNADEAYTYTVEFAIVRNSVEVYSAPIAYVPKTNEENQ